MKYPVLQIYFDENDTLCFAKQDKQGVPFRLIIDVIPEEITACSQAELQEKVGGTIVGLLKLWNKELFDGKKNPD